MKRVSLLFTLAVAAAVSGTAASAETLKTVKDRGMLSCGVSQGLPGFSTPDDKGNWTGFDVDVCRAIAAAIFNDPAQVKYLPLSAKARATPLQRPAIGRDRRSVAQLDLDVVARFFARHHLRGRQLLRRPGLHGAQVPQ